MARTCIYCGVGESFMHAGCLSTGGHWFNNILSSPVTADVTVNAILKRKLEIAMRGLDEYGDEENWLNLGEGQTFDVWYNAERGYELARRIKAEIEEVK